MNRHPMAKIWYGSGASQLHLVRTRAFTLVELLVVITIIGVLIAMLMPAISQAREATKRAVCLVNLHQWAIATASFGGDFKTRIPRGIDYYATWSGAGNSPTTSRPAEYTGDISKYFWTVRNSTTDYGNFSGGGSAAICARIAYPDGAGGQTVSWRLTEIGVLILKGYITTPKTLYCPGTERPALNYWWLDSPAGASYWTNISQGKTAGNSFSTAGVEVGYVSYLHGLEVATAQPAGSEKKWPAAPTLDWLAENWQRSTDASPLLFSCYSDTGSWTAPFTFGITSHRGQNPYPPGVNGAMYDGSARWIDTVEVRKMADAQAGLNQSEDSGWLEAYRLDNNSWVDEDPSTSLYLSRKFRFNYLSRAKLGIVRSPK